MQPIIFDHINKVVIQVGTNPEADRRYAELAAAATKMAGTGSTPAR